MAEWQTNWGTDWLGGYSAQWDIYSVNPDTWVPESRIESVQNVSISRDGTDSVPLLETATMTIDSSNPFEWSWCQISMRAEQGSAERIPIATVLCEIQSFKNQYRSDIATIRGRSVLQPAADRKLDKGSFIAAGANGATYIETLLKECTPAPVSVDGEFTLVEDYTFDTGSSYLAAIWGILDAAGWCIQIEGNGTIHICPKPTEPDLVLDYTKAGLLMPGIDRTLDISNVPNKYIATDGRETAIATNEDPDRMGSYPRRGRWIEEYDSNPVKINGESLQLYAERKLDEMSTVMREFSYTREFWPNIVPFSLVEATLSEHGISGSLRVMSQTLNCGKGITVNEKVGQEVLV